MRTIEELSNLITAKMAQSRALEAQLKTAVGGILDAPTPAIRAKLAADRRAKIDEIELITQELDLLRFRLLETEALKLRFGETTTFAPLKREYF